MGEGNQQEFVGPEEVEYLRLIFGGQQEQQRVLESIDHKLSDLLVIFKDEPLVASTLQTISTTLSTFLADWTKENTPPPPGPAVKVTVTWGPPQYIPKGN